MQSPKIPAFLLALLMVLGTVLVIGPAEARPVGASHNVTIDAVLGAEAPYGEWEKTDELATLYLHSAPGGYGSTADLAAANPHVSFQTPRAMGYAASWVAITGPGLLEEDSASFPMTAPALDDAMIYGAGASIFAMCDGDFEASVLANGPLVKLWQETLDPATSEWTRVGNPILSVDTAGSQDAPTLAPSQIAALGDAFPLGADPANFGFYANFVGASQIGSPLQEDGHTVPAGDRLSVEVFAGLVSSECVIIYDTNRYNSQVELWSDSARHNIWIEDSQGQPTEGLPSAAAASVGDRRFTIQHLQASPWPGMTVQSIIGNEYGGDPPATMMNADAYCATSGSDGDTCGSNYRVRQRDFVEVRDRISGDLFFDSQAYEPEFDSEAYNPRLQPFQMTQDVETVLDPGANGHSLRLRSYPIHYPADTPEGLYRIEVQNIGNGQYTKGNTYRGEDDDFTGVWQVTKDFAIGGKGLLLDTVVGEATNHLVNRGEPTEFRFRLTNLGYDDDLVTVTASEPGSGFTASVTPGLVSLGGGRTSFLTLSVTTPDTATLAAPKSITITATSSHEEVAPQVSTVTVTPTATVKSDVELDAVKDRVAIHPGETVNVGATLINRGHARDHFVLAPDLPADAAQWGISVTPLSSQLVAHGRQEVTIGISAPAEVPDGFSFPLTLDARRIGDASIQDAATITVDVVHVEGITVTDLGAGLAHAMREKGSEVCINADVGVIDCGLSGGTPNPDTDFDPSTLHRILVENDGDGEARLKLEAFWDRDATDNEQISAYCTRGGPNTNRNGVPDGWRFNYGDDVATPFSPVETAQDRGEQNRHTSSATTSFGGYHHLHTEADPLVIPARSATYLYMEIGYWPVRDVCPNDAELIGSGLPIEDPQTPVNSESSSEAGLTLNFRSIDDETLARSITLVNEVQVQGTGVGANDYTGAFHEVLVEPELDQDTFAQATELAAAEFTVRALNRGNEVDDLVIDVSDSERGWTYAVEPVPGSHMPANIVCEAPTNSGLRVRCPGLGINDEVALRVTATPDPSVRVGDVADFEVIVSSGDDTSIRDTLDLRARLSGAFDYEIELPNNDITAAIGDTVNIPFTIVNRGTEGDTYDIALHSGDLSYSPFIAGATSIFVPGGFSYTAVLSLDIPADATVGQQKLFELFIDSPNVPALKPDLFITPIAASTLALTPTNNGGSPITDVVIADRNTPQDVHFRASDPTGTTSSVTFTADTLTLPRGWSVSPDSVTVNLAGSGVSRADATFQVTAPEDALGASRVPLRVTATTDETTPRSRAADLILNTATNFGLTLEIPNGTDQTIAAASDAVYTVLVHNDGFAPDTAVLSLSGAPPGWSSFISPVTVPLGALETKAVTLQINAPATAIPGTTATTLLRAESLSDAAASNLLTLTTTIGVFDLGSTSPEDTVYVAPQESADRIIRVVNNGTVPDQIQVTAVLATAGLQDHVEFSFEPGVFELDPGEAKDVALTVALGQAIPAKSTLAFDIAATSLLDPATAPATSASTTTVDVLDYEARDIDGDGTVEYALDRDRDRSNGFEQFRENSDPSGFTARSLDVTQYLSPAARTAFTAQVTDAQGNTESVLIHEVDGDSDGRRDHFVDRDGDALPDIYWDPDGRAHDVLDVRRDIDADGVFDYFLSLDDDDDFDAVYNLRSGRFTMLLQLEIDGDGQLDYVVDKNGDGTRNPDEAVLLSDLGNLVSIVKVDLTGNGDLDDVVDDDGDGRPDHFVPAGSSDGIAIKLKDVTGDGVLDWTYDADSDGREDSFYNPQDGSVGTIDVAENFAQLIKDYWYVLVLFALVSVLFVVLVAVTRR